jgi:hypothetical protein
MILQSAKNVQLFHWCSVQAFHAWGLGGKAPERPVAERPGHRWNPQTAGDLQTSGVRSLTGRQSPVLRPGLAGRLCRLGWGKRYRACWSNPGRVRVGRAGGRGGGATEVVGLPTPHFPPSGETTVQCVGGRVGCKEGGGAPKVPRVCYVKYFLFVSKS